MRRKPVRYDLASMRALLFHLRHDDAGADEQADNDEAEKPTSGRNASGAKPTMNIGRSNGRRGQSGLEIRMAAPLIQAYSIGPMAVIY